MALEEQVVDNAMKTATAGSMGIAGVEQPDVATRGPVNISTPPPPPVQQGGLQPAEYGWRVGQDDFGQKPVASIATPSGPVPVAQQGYAFPAIAARQQALAERKNNLKAAQDKAMAAFDPFKGIADPADPYQTTFDQYIRSSYQKKRAEMAEAGFGGDVAAFDRWVAQTPEGAMWVRQNFTMPMDAIAKENKGRVTKVADFLTKVAEGKRDVDPEDFQVLQAYTTAGDDQGVPLPYEDSLGYLLKGRSAEEVISKSEFQKNFLGNFKEFGEQMPTVVTFERPSGAGGKMVMRVTDPTVFDDYISAQVDNAMSQQMFNRDRAEAEKWMRKLIKDRYDVKVTASDPYESVERKEAAKVASAEGAGKGPQGGWGYSPSMSRTLDASGNRVPTNYEAEFVTATELVGNRRVDPAPFRMAAKGNPRGVLVSMNGFQKDQNGEWFVIGEEVDDQVVQQYNDWREKKGLGPTKLETPSAEETALFETFKQERKIKQGQPYRQKLSSNRAQIASKFGTADPYAIGGVKSAVEAYNAANAKANGGAKMTTADFESLSRAQQEQLMSQYGR